LHPRERGRFSKRKNLAGWDTLHKLTAFNTEFRSRIAVVELGGGQAAMSHARQYTTERQQFSVAISSMQGLQWMMPATYTHLEASRILLINTVRQNERKENVPKAGSMVKLRAAETAGQVF
jgi:alkylation response protein AidB-like acyl-CoA dehydrogenase